MGEPDNGALCQAPPMLHLVLSLKQPPKEESRGPEAQGGEGRFAQENTVRPQGDTRPWRAMPRVELELPLLLLTRVTVTRLESEKSSEVSFWVSISLTWGLLSWGQLKGNGGGRDPHFPWANPCTQVFQRPKGWWVLGSGTVNPFTASFQNTP